MMSAISTMRSPSRYTAPVAPRHARESGASGRRTATNPIG
jgi:hypothetical protein